MQDLAVIEQCAHALATAETVEQAKAIRDQADAAFSFWRSQRGKSDDAVRQAAALKVRAERRIGELLRDMPKDAGGRPSENLSPVSTGLRLDDLGVSRNDSSKWQKLAHVPVEEFDRFIEACISLGDDITTAAALRFAEPYLPQREPREVEPPSTVTFTRVERLEPVDAIFTETRPPKPKPAQPPEPEWVEVEDDEPEADDAGELDGRAAREAIEDFEFNMLRFADRLSPHSQSFFIQVLRTAADQFEAILQARGANNDN